jgi:transposase
VGAVIRAAGAKLFFLPKYSPDMNPIEQVFAKLFQQFRPQLNLTSSRFRPRGRFRFVATEQNLDYPQCHQNRNNSHHDKHEGCSTFRVQT